MATAAATIIESDGWVDGTLKTTQAGKLVIQVEYGTANNCAIGEVVQVTENDPRLFRITGKGNPFPIQAAAATIAALKARGYSKRDIARELQAVYLYVTEVTPAPVVATPATAEVCTECAAVNPVGSMCPMSDDGEGPHRLAAQIAATDADMAFMARYDIHSETIHSTITAFGKPLALCDDARRFLLQRATGNGGSGFTTRRFSTDGVTCADCAAVLRAGSPNVLPAPEVRRGPPARSKLMAQIRAGMRQKYGPGIEDPEWAVETYR